MINVEIIDLPKTKCTDFIRLKILARYMKESESV